VTRLRAHLDGFSTPPRDSAVADADIIITVTGARDELTGAAEVTGTTEYADDLLTLELRDGRRVHLLARGHVFNLAGPRPLGNSIESMDLGFALQARCLEAVARRGVDATSCVVPVPGAIDAAVARSYLDRKYPG
jgi:adenosylhomocysteinase